MSAVLATPPFLQFQDANGDPLAGGLIYTYAAGTTTPKATYTDSTGLIPMSNPIVLDSAGRATWWLIGAYKYVVKDSLGNTISTTDNVTAFNTLADANNAFFQSFSGTGSQTAFTLSSDLGTEENGLMIFINKGLEQAVSNGSFATDTIWTKGAGWTIGSGVATATGAISTAISQTSLVTLVVGQAYAVTYTITRSAGGLIPSIGGVSGVERTASGTYREIIIASSIQTIAFTGNAFTGTLDDVSVTVADSAGYDIQNPSAYTVSGTSLTFATAPALGTNNIYVFAPSLLLGAASAAASLAQAYATSALASQVSAAASATSAIAYQTKNKWTYSNTVTMSDPGSGFIRFNNLTLSSATSLAISDISADPTAPDLSAWVNIWDDGSGLNRGTLYIFKDTSNFILYTVPSANVDGGTWNKIFLTYLSSTGSFSNGDSLYIGFAASGVTTVTGGITALTGDVTASGSGSVAATYAGTVPVTKGGTGLTTLTANNVILGNGTSAPSFVAPGTLGNVLTSDGTTWISSLVTGAVKSVKQQTFLSSGTYTPSTGMLYVLTFCTGGGGGGGSTATSTSGGGGGGGTAIKVVTAATIGASQSITIGAGGAGSGATNAPGSTGGTSSVGAIVTGIGGVGGGSDSGTNARQGGTGGSATGGDLNIQGGAGTGAATSSGSGGGSFLGGGGKGGGSAAAGTSAVANSGGGGGGGNGTANGGSGVVYIIEFCSQ